MRILSSVIIATIIAGLSINLAQAKQETVIKNYIDGVSYSVDGDGRKSKLLVSKEKTIEGDVRYSLFVNQKDKDDNFFTILTNLEVSPEGFDISHINKAIDKSLNNDENSVVRLKQIVPLHEIDSIYGKESFLSKEMRRCNLSEIQMAAKIEGGYYTIKVNEMMPNTFTNDTIHLLSFC